MRSATIRALVPLLFAIAGGSSAGTLVLSDGVFDPADWMGEIVVNENTSDPGTGSFVVEQVMSGGDPGSYRRVTLDFPGGNLVVAHFRDDWVYEPSTGGAILSIDYAYSLMKESSGQDIRYRLILEQDGIYYSAIDGDIAQSSAWVPVFRSGLTSASFTSDPLSPNARAALVPDFTEAGAPIRIGYRSSNCCNSSTTSGIDSFSVSLTRLDGPLVFTDGDFDPVAWTAETIFDGSGSPPPFEAEQVMSGGDPGSYRRVALDFPDGNLVVAHFHDDWVYTPSSQGTIESLDYGYSLLKESPGQDIRYRFVLEQDGTYYSAIDGDVAESSSWSPVARLGLTAGSFTSDTLTPNRGVGTVPDFTETGGPIRIGYRSSNCCSGSTISGIDNFIVTVHRDPIDCRVSPATLDFGNVPAGATVQRSFVLTNVSGAQLVGNVSEICDPFFIASGGGPFVLAPGDSITVSVGFTPPTVGDFECVVEAGCLGVPAVGTGTPPVDLLATSIACAVAGDDSVRVTGEFENVGPGDSGPFQVRLEITGCNPLWTDTQLIAGLDAGETSLIQVGPLPVEMLPCSASLIVDTEDAVFEPDESNNDLIDVQTCFFPNITPIELSCRQDPPTSKTVVVEGVFENTGQASSGPFAARIEIQGCVGLVAETQPVPGMQPGESRSMTVGPFASSEDLCSATLIVDVSDDVIETSEGDNQLDADVDCTVVEAPSSGDVSLAVPTMKLRPNPSPGHVTVSLDGPWGVSTVTVFDLVGRVVRRFGVGTDETRVVWDTRDGSGGRVAPGVYFVRAEGKAQGRTERLLLVR